MTAPNAELAYRVLDHIDLHPEQWDQGLYIGKAECGTVACFAGWACLLSGETPHFVGGRPQTTDYLLNDTPSRWLLVSDSAEELLGAPRLVDEGTDYEDDLFAPDNTREDLGRLVAEIFGPRPDVTA